LTQAERIAKRNLKKHLKQKTRLHKYETRMHQAVLRRDSTTEARARQEWHDYYQFLLGDPDSFAHQPDFQLQRTAESQRVRQGREWLTKIWLRLISKLQQETDAAKNDKQAQTDQARTLLQNMTKGTQTESMFDNDMALLGYTRQKFMERALLAVTSLDRLEATKKEQQTSTTTTTTAHSLVWNRLLQTNPIYSIGCGPGCDALSLGLSRKPRESKAGTHRFDGLCHASMETSGSGLSIATHFPTLRTSCRYSLVRCPLCLDRGIQSSCP
jgi:hypothetical protein